MNKQLREILNKDLESYPIVFLLEAGFNRYKNRRVRWITAIAPWHHESYFTDGEYNSYDGILRDDAESADDDGNPNGALGGDNDHLCSSIGSEKFEVMAAIGKAFAEIGESPKNFEDFWSTPQSFLKSRGLDRSYRYSYRIVVQREDT